MFKQKKRYYVQWHEKQNGTVKLVSVQFFIYEPVMSVYNQFLAFLLQSLLCSYCVGMPLMIFDDTLPSRHTPEILMYHDMHKLFEINRLIAINFGQLIDLKNLISTSPNYCQSLILSVTRCVFRNKKCLLIELGDFGGMPLIRWWYAIRMSTPNVCLWSSISPSIPRKWSFSVKRFTRGRQSGGEIYGASYRLVSVSPHWLHRHRVNGTRAAECPTKTSTWQAIRPLLNRQRHYKWNRALQRQGIAFNYTLLSQFCVRLSRVAVNLPFLSSAADG